MSDKLGLRLIWKISRLKIKSTGGLSPETAEMTISCLPAKSDFGNQAKFTPVSTGRSLPPESTGNPFSLYSSLDSSGFSTSILSCISSPVP